MVYYFSKRIIILLGKLFFRVQANGVENIPKNGGFILASNHASYLDPAIVGSSCPRDDLYYLAREDLFKNKGFAWWLKHVHVVALKRNSADISAVKESLALLNQGKGLILFPTGTRTIDGRITDLHEGVGFLAYKAKVPVVPACVRGTERALPKGAKSVKFTRVKVVFGKPINILGFSGFSEKEAYRKITENIGQEINRMWDAIDFA